MDFPSLVKSNNSGKNPKSVNKDILTIGREVESHPSHTNRNSILTSWALD